MGGVTYTDELRYMPDRLPDDQWEYSVSLERLVPIALREMVVMKAGTTFLGWHVNTRSHEVVLRFRAPVDNSQ